MYDVNGQLLFSHAKITREVACPTCGAAAAQPCVNRWGERITGGLQHASRLQTWLDVFHKPTAVSTENQSLSL